MRLRQQQAFYVWDEATGEVRWMTSFDTTEADVDEFVAAISQEMAGSSEMAGSKEMAGPGIGSTGSR